MWCDIGGAPATSVPSERANSVGEQTFEGRASLSDEVFKAEVCIKSWLPLLEEFGIEIPKDALEAWNTLKGEKEAEEASKAAENQDDVHFGEGSVYANSDNVIAFMYANNI